MYTLAELAEVSGARLQGDGTLVITGLNTLKEATAQELSFLANPVYARYLPDSKAGAVILAPASAADFTGNALILDDPYLGYARLSHFFKTAVELPAGIDPSATVSPDAQIHPQSAIGPEAVIEAGVIVAKGVVIASGAVIGHDSIIGEDTHIARNVTVCHGVSIGKRVIIHPGAVIGSDGFGNAREKGRWVKIAQIGGVLIGDDVEIGANTCIDRGALGNTVISDGVRLDNLIQVAHNVVIGKNTAIASLAGISGSTQIGENCTIAGSAGFAGHLTIADNTHIGGMAMVTGSIKKAGVYASGTGFMEAREWRKNAVRFRQLDNLARRVKHLEKT